MRASGLSRILLVGTTLTAMGAALLRTYPPYLWMAGIGLVACGIWFAIARGRERVLAFNLGAVVLILGIAELFAWKAAPAGPLRTRTEPDFVISHPLLGNAPDPGVRTLVTRWDGDSLIFRVRYTIDSLGWRWTPDPRPAGGTSREAMFFGCSLTFGEGLPDSATLPAQVALQSEGRWRADNFGFSGYGPHQMLAILEDSLETRALAGAPVAAVYQAIPGHIYRALGRTSWDPGPRFRLGPDGHVRFAGRFLSPRASLFLNLFYRSFLLRRVIDGWNARLRPRDYATFLAIVSDARDLLQRRYPGLAFTILYWDSRDRTPEATALDDSLLAGFARHGLRVVRVSDILSGYPAEAGRYLLSPHDAHPNALADRRLARALLDRVLPGDTLAATAGRDAAGGDPRRARTEPAY